MMNLQRREEIRVMMNRLESTEWVEAGEYKEAMSELLAHIDTLEQTAAERVIRGGSSRLWNGQKAIADRRDALRANQGGAAT